MKTEHGNTSLEAVAHLYIPCSDKLKVNAVTTYLSLGIWENSRSVPQKGALYL